MRLGKVLLIFTLVVITIGVTSFLFFNTSAFPGTLLLALLLLFWPLSPLLLFPYFYEKLGVIDKRAFVYWAVAIATWSNFWRFQAFVFLTMVFTTSFFLHSTITFKFLFCLS
ncbi:hypothetical protein B9Q02_02165 [Candidatus Marsarchaeota G1 archaeon BE_D]|jgi:hypothetical protein|uniref:Uncharacterized protein n=1 Tax=Candidatus Marsarchaeota G1 archaeon BE_D TaxID=1978156 RepID=A0A2R6AJJ2_9ARCH|nr:MAG: hypothetical protein B9Q02_02165 [Candidatus Marsarchaeota G1 archaeon BE_D]